MRQRAIHEPANAATNHDGTPGRAAVATAATAATIDTCTAMSHNTSSRPPAAVDMDVTRASCPSEQSKQYATCHTSHATSPTTTAVRLCAATDAAVTITNTDAPTPNRRLAIVSTVGRTRRR